jgi:hypothetical protein
MPGVADQDHVTPVAGIALHFHVNLRNEGHVASNTVRPRAFASFSSALDTPCAEKMTVPFGRNLTQLLDENRAQPPQPVDDMTVVHDLVTHIDRGSEELDRALHDVDRAIDTGTEAAGIGEKNIHLNTHLVGAPALSPCIQEQQDRPDGDRRIRYVKRWKMMLTAPVGRNEIDYVTDAQPIDHITECAAQNQGQAAAQQPL